MDVLRRALLDAPAAHGVVDVAARLSVADVCAALDCDAADCDWKAITKVLQQAIRDDAGLHFVYHDVRTSGRKYAHCSRYLCALRATGKAAEAARRRQNDKVVRHECRGLLTCAVLHGWREMLVTVYHVDHAVVGVAPVPPEPPADADAPLPKKPRARARRPTRVPAAAPPLARRDSYVAADGSEGTLSDLEFSLPAAKRPRTHLRSAKASSSAASSHLPSPMSATTPATPVFAPSFLANAQERAPMFNSPGVQAPLPLPTPHLAHSMPAPFSSHALGLPIDLDLGGLPPAHHHHHPFLVSPGLPIYERPLSAMSGFQTARDLDEALAAQAPAPPPVTAFAPPDHAPPLDLAVQAANQLLPAALDAIRRGRAPQPELDALLAGARRLLEAADHAEQLAAAAAVAAARDEAARRHPLLDDRAALLAAPSGSLGHELGGAPDDGLGVFGMSADSWRMLRLLP